MTSRRIDARRFIEKNLHLELAPLLPEIRLYLAHPASGLSRIARDDGAPPYWAYLWPGGAVLARYFLDRPQTVRDKIVLDIGTGSGVVAIAAKLAGARHVVANDIDDMALVATQMNAAANGAEVGTISGDVLDGELPAADLIAIGDLFFHADVSARVIAFAQRCLAVGKTVLTGDIGRAHLPREQLETLMSYDVPDFGDRRDTTLRTGSVFKFTK